jgi:hypothetical protein
MSCAFLVSFSVLFAGVASTTVPFFKNKNNILLYIITNAIFGGSWVNELLLDIRDQEGDTKENISTMATVFDKQTTWTIAQIILHINKNKQYMSKFYKISDDTISIFKSTFSKKSFPFNVGFEFVGSESQKSLIKISKMPDQFSFILEKELLIQINEDLMQVFDDESIQILFEQEIDKISVNMDTGKIKMVKPDLTTFSSLINKYGIEKIARANKVEELYSQQKEDAQEDFLM